MQHDVDPKEALKTEIGSLENVEVFNNSVLVAIYMRPKRTKSGLYLADQTVGEDQYQSKVGLVVKKGSAAFVDPDERWFQGVTVEVYDWIIFRPSDGWDLTVNGVKCRMLIDTSVRGRVSHADDAY
jgi:co-chaperonin GroES (HSP10)